jgi:hypothetical protein
MCQTMSSVFTTIASIHKVLLMKFWLPVLLLYQRLFNNLEVL